MNKIRTVISTVFQSPMDQMSFPAYFSYVNEAGKVTARSLMETQAVILTFLEEQEKTNELNAANFKEIEAILEKLTTPSQADQQMAALDKPLDLDAFAAPSPATFPCPECGRVCQTKIGLLSHRKTHKAKE